MVPFTYVCIANIFRKPSINPELYSLYMYLIRRFVVKYLRVVPYFDEPVGRVKIQTTSKNSKRYYTTKRLIRDLLSNTPNFYVRAGEFRGYLFTGNA